MMAEVRPLPRCAPPALAPPASGRALFADYSPCSPALERAHRCKPVLLGCLLLQLDIDRSGGIEYSEFLTIIERQKAAQAGAEADADTVEAFVALGGKVRCPWRPLCTSSLGRGAALGPGLQSSKAGLNSLQRAGARSASAWRWLFLQADRSGCVSVEKLRRTIAEFDLTIDINKVGCP